MSAFGGVDNPFTSYYAQLLHQGNMMQDHVRTSTYQKAFVENRSDFEGQWCSLSSPCRTIKRILGPSLTNTSLPSALPFSIIIAHTTRAGKVVLDVGTGSGLLAFFAVQAGAKIVYAVEASDSAAVAMDLCKANGMEGRVKIIKGKIEEVRVL